MLRLRPSTLTGILSSPSASPVSHLHRLLSTVASAVPPSPSFAVEDYLVDTCGLTRAQDLKASAKLFHLKSPSKPDAVRAFLAGLGFSGADIAALVAKDPLFLCTTVDRVLRPNVVELAGLGLSRPQIARLASASPLCFRCKSVVSNLPYHLRLFGSYDNLLRVLRKTSSILGHSLEKLVKPNVEFLRECGLGDCDISKLCLSAPWLLGTKPERVRAAVASAEGLGVPRGSGMFRQALAAVSFLGDENIATKLDYLKKTFRWSDAEVRAALCRAPTVLARSQDALQSKWEFLISEVGLEPAYIARRPVLIGFNLEGRLRPRYYVLKLLKEKGLLDCSWSYSAVMVTDKVFMERCISPHSEAVPHLAEGYVAACRGEVPRLVSDLH